MSSNSLFLNPAGFIHTALARDTLRAACTPAAAPLAAPAAAPKAPAAVAPAESFFSRVGAYGLKGVSLGRDVAAPVTLCVDAVLGTGRIRPQPHFGDTGVVGYL